MQKVIKNCSHIIDIFAKTGKSLPSKGNIYLSGLDVL